MKLKSWVKYLLYFIFIFSVVYGAQNLFLVMRSSIENWGYYGVKMMLIFYFSIGFLLGLEHLLCETKKEGAWKINFPKIIVIGIPSLYFSLAFYLYFNNNQFVQNILAYPVGIFMRGGDYLTSISVFQLLLGYSIITSFYKKSEK